MIRYKLVCDERHEFESWFPSSDECDAQAAANLIECPYCGSTAVAKTLMAPALSRADAQTPPLDRTALGRAETPFAEPARRLRAVARAIHEHVRATAEGVGERFASEARAMHYGDVPHRPIYGQASLREASALVEEGVAVCPLPPCPDEGN